jgi:hypothetical protein
MPAEAVSDQPQSVRTLQRDCLACGSAFALNPRHAKEHRYCSARCRAAHYRADKQRAIPGESRVERAFREWIASEDGQIVEDEVIRRARKLQRMGRKSYGIAALVEAIRYDNAIRILGTSDGFRINNSHRSLLARRVMERVPELREFFTCRDLRGRA